MVRETRDTDVKKTWTYLFHPTVCRGHQSAPPVHYSSLTSLPAPAKTQSNTILEQKSKSRTRYGLKPGSSLLKILSGGFNEQLQHVTWLKLILRKRVWRSYYIELKLNHKNIVVTWNKIINWNKIYIKLKLILFKLFAEATFLIFILKYINKNWYNYKKPY